jgi:hypothetical protein
MSWENQGTYWDFDHVVPCAQFNFEDKKHIKVCYHWTNLRPCEKKENITKRDKIIYPIIDKQYNTVIEYLKCIGKFIDVPRK